MKYEWVLSFPMAIAITTSGSLQADVVYNRITKDVVIGKDATEVGDTITITPCQGKEPLIFSRKTHGLNHGNDCGRPIHESIPALVGFKCARLRGDINSGKPLSPKECTVADVAKISSVFGPVDGGSRVEPKPGDEVKWDLGLGSSTITWKKKTITVQH